MNDRTLDPSCIWRDGCPSPQMCRGVGHCQSLSRALATSRPVPDETLERSKPQILPAAAIQPTAKDAGEPLAAVGGSDPASASLPSKERVSEETIRTWMASAPIESGVATDMASVCPKALVRACQELLENRAEIEGLKHDLARYMDIANAEVNESEGLRFGLAVIKRGPPTELSNSEVAAWAATVAERALRGMPSDETTERTPKDYAIEHAEYMAQAAEGLMAAANELSVDGTPMPAIDRHSHAYRALESRIYEFRKRAERAAVRSGETPVRHDEIAWLVETSFGPYTHYFEPHWSPALKDWCLYGKDPNRATRFPTQETAEGALKWLQSSQMKWRFLEGKATEHMWPAVKSSAPSFRPCGCEGEACKGHPEKCDGCGATLPSCVCPAGDEQPVKSAETPTSVRRYRINPEAKVGEYLLVDSPTGNLVDWWQYEALLKKLAAANGSEVITENNNGS